jgi:hypothetical protein
MSSFSLAQSQKMGAANVGAVYGATDGDGAKKIRNDITGKYGIDAANLPSASFDATKMVSEINEFGVNKFEDPTSSKK